MAGQLTGVIKDIADRDTTGIGCCYLTANGIKRKACCAVLGIDGCGLASAIVIDPRAFRLGSLDGALIAVLLALHIFSLVERHHLIGSG